MSDLKRIRDNFLQQIKDAHDGRGSPLPFIIHPIAREPIVELGKKFQVIVIGGTNYQTAYATKRGDKDIQLSQIKEGEAPIFNTKQDFLEFMGNIVKSDIKYIGLNFAYSLKAITVRSSVIDGALESGGKKSAFKGLVGNVIGNTIENYLKAINGKDYTCAVANDTFCLLQGGQVAYTRQTLGAGIVGTGVNIAFYLNELYGVNLQASSFNNFPTSPTFQAVDKQSLYPGFSPFEREVPGKYLYQHFNANPETRKTLSSTKDLDIIARRGRGRDKVIAQKLFQRSAMLFAAAISAVVEFKKTDMHFIMEGNVFWKGWKYKETVEKHMRELSPKYNVTFFQQKNSGLIGAAKLLV